MDGFLTQLGAACDSEVPAICLTLATSLDERGDAEAAGWLTLVKHRKHPQHRKSGTTWTWRCSD